MFLAGPLVTSDASIRIERPTLLSLIAKSRIATLQFMTIPRLELNTAVLAVRLAIQVQ